MRNALLSLLVFISPLALFAGPDSDFKEAFRSVNYKEMSRALREGAEINEAYWGQTYLHVAIQLEAFDPLRYKSLVSYLVKNGAGVNILAPNGKHTMHQAAESNSPRLIEYLLEKGATLDPADRAGKTPLLLAIERGNFGAVEILMQRGANWRAVSQGSKGALYYAVQSRKPRILDLILRKGLNPNLRNGEVIKLAAARGPVALMELLHAAGAKLNVRDKKGNSLLHLAVKNEKTGTVRFLLGHGALVDVRNRSGKTPLALALNEKKKPSMLRILRLLLEKGANPNKPVEGKLNSLMKVAKMQKNPELARAYSRLLLRHGGRGSIADVIAANKFWLLEEYLEKVGVKSEAEKKRLLELAVKKSSVESLMELRRIWPGMKRGLGAGSLQALIHDDLAVYRKDTIRWKTRGIRRDALMLAITMKSRNITRFLLRDREAGYNPLNKNRKDAFGNTYLMLAALYGNLPVLKTLLKQGASPETRDYLGRNAFLLAAGAETPSRGVLLELLKAGVDHYAVDKWGRNALELAVLKKNHGLISLLLKRGVSPHKMSRFGSSALIVAADAGDMQTLKLFRKQGVDLTKVNSKGNTLLTEFLKRGRLDVIGKLLGIGFAPDSLDIHGRTALMGAAMANQVDAVRMLLKYKSNVNAVDYRGETPLMLATYKERRKVVKILLKNGANIRIKSKSGYDLMGRLTQWSRVETLKYLFTQKIQVSEADVYKYMETALIHKRPRAFQFWLRRYVMLKQKNQSGMTPLMRFAGRPQTPLRFFIQEKVNLNARDKDGWSALYYAVVAGNELNAAYLIKAGVDLDRGDVAGDTPLHHGVRRGRVKVVRLLLTKGAGVNKLNQNGNTPLMGAVGSGSVELVILLLKKGARPDLKNKSGLSALDMAKQEELSGIIRVLRAAAP